MNRDEEHLNLLSIFHFVLGGFLFLFACIPLLHVGMGILILSGALDGPEDVPPFIGWFFIIFPAVFILGGWTVSGLVIYAGCKLRQHQMRTFCIVVAALECMFAPFGTILGVFSIVVLTRDSVARLFEGNPFGVPRNAAPVVTPVSPPPFDGQSGG